MGGAIRLLGIGSGSESGIGSTIKAMSTAVDKELLEAATLSLQAQERLTAVLHRKLKTNEDSSSKEGEKTRDSITSIARSAYT